MGGFVAVGGEGDAAVVLASRMFVTHASPGGKTEAFVAELLEQGRRVLIFDDAENQRLLDMGAEPVAPGQLPV